MNPILVAFLTKIVDIIFSRKKYEERNMFVDDDIYLDRVTVIDNISPISSLDRAFV